MRYSVRTHFVPSGLASKPKLVIGYQLPLQFVQENTRRHTQTSSSRPVCHQSDPITSHPILSTSETRHTAPISATRRALHHPPPGNPDKKAPVTLQPYFSIVTRKQPPPLSAVHSVHPEHPYAPQTPLSQRLGAPPRDKDQHSTAVQRSPDPSRRSDSSQSDHHHAECPVSIPTLPQHLTVLTLPKTIK